MSFAKNKYGIELDSPFPNKTQGYFKADKVVSGKKDFTKEMKDLMSIDNELQVDKINVEDLGLKTVKTKDLINLEFLFEI